MTSLRELKVRSSVVSSIKKITSAMKMISVMKMKQAQIKLDFAKKYDLEMDSIFKNIYFSNKIFPYVTANQSAEKMFVIFTSDNGLCGAFNTEAILAAMSNSKGKTFCVGTRGSVILEKRISIEKLSSALFNSENCMNKISKIAQKIYDLCKNGGNSECFIAYHKFHNIAKNEFIVEKILPFRYEKKNPYFFEDKDEDSKELEDFFVSKIASKLYVSFMENLASEHGTRIIVMDNAVSNSDDMLKKIESEYNKLRQFKITTELLEVIFGAEAL